MVEHRAAVALRVLWLGFWCTGGSWRFGRCGTVFATQRELGLRASWRGFWQIGGSCGFGGSSFDGKGGAQLELMVYG